MDVGDTDGHGHYGILDEDDRGLLCHECGRRYRHLATHISGGHHITVAQYREKHGLHATRPLVAQTVSRKMRQSWDKHADTHLATLDTHRDPQAATVASIPAIKKRSAGAKASRGDYLHARKGERRPQGRPATTEERAQLDAATSIAEWCTIVRTILEDPTTTASALANSLGMKPTTLYQRLNRNP